MVRSTDFDSRSRATILELALRGLAAWHGLKDEVAARLLDEACPLEWIPAGGRISWDDGYPGPKLVVRGWVGECRFLPGMPRQIFDFLLPGDICFPLARRSVPQVELVALTTVRVLSLAPALRHRQGAAVRDLLRAADEQNVGRRYDAAIRLGQFSSEERTLDLLAELCERLKALELVTEEGFRLPITQADVADALGMSAVHLNRTLAALKKRGLVTLRSGRVVLSSQGSGRPIARSRHQPRRPANAPR